MMYKYKFWATLLDAFTNYLFSDTLWEKFWVWQEVPPHTPEEFKIMQKQALIDNINKVEREPIELADRGTCFNEIIDSLILHKPTEREDMQIIFKENEITAQMHGFSFVFPREICEKFALKYEN